jgi:hypothetical protein
MVSERVNIKDKYRVHKKVIKIFFIVFIILFVLISAFSAGFFLNKTNTAEIVIENPLKNILVANTNSGGVVDTDKVVEQGGVDFNEDYINYVLAALGTGYLHKSILGENPLLELVLENEVWSSEIIQGVPNSKKGQIDKEDLRITMNKEEAVKALLSSDIKQFMKDSVANGNTKIEIVAGKAELFSKGYLEMYKKMTGEEINAD